MTLKVTVTRFFLSLCCFSVSRAGGSDSFTSPVCGLQPGQARPWGRARGSAGKNTAKGREKNLLSSGGRDPWVLLRKKALTWNVEEHGKRKTSKQGSQQGAT